MCLVENQGHWIWGERETELENSGIFVSSAGSVLMVEEKEGPWFLRERESKQRHKQSWKTQGFCFCNYYSWFRKSKDFDFWKRKRDKQSWKSQGFFFVHLLLIVEKQSGERQDGVWSLRNWWLTTWGLKISSSISHLKFSIFISHLLFRIFKPSVLSLSPFQFFFLFFVVFFFLVAISCNNKIARLTTVWLSIQYVKRRQAEKITIYQRRRRRRLHTFSFLFSLKRMGFNPIIR